MKWTIAFDAGCEKRELPQGGPAELVLVPMKILVGNQDVVDDGKTSLEELQALLDQRPKKTGTACPSVGDWKNVMEREGNVIVITISGTVSGSYQSACAARDMVLEEQPDKKVFVLNSLSGSGLMDFLVDKALYLIEKGHSFEEVTAELEHTKRPGEIFFLLQNVDNLMSNGRLNSLVGRAVKAMRLCMVGTVNGEGSMGVIGKVRGFEKTMDRSIEECVKRGCTPKRVLITHCMNLDGARKMREKLLARFPQAEVEIRRIGLLCGYYAEKGGLIVAMDP